MENVRVDVAIIGAGTAGMGAYRAAKNHTDSLVLIEGGPYGTTCARVGCMPSKLLIAAAEAAHSLAKAPALGIHPGPGRVDGREVMARVRRERDRFVGFVLEAVEGFDTGRKLRGRARFLDDHRLQVDDHTTVVADRIVIAVGSSPVVPEPFRVFGDRLLINDDVFEWEDLPESVAVFGPGVIGLELGQALHRLGVRVKVFGRGGRVGPLSDPVLAEYAKKTFQQELYLDPDAEMRDMRRVDDGVELRYVDLEGVERVERFEWALAAVGRAPNLGDLGLENTSLALNAKGLPEYDPFTMQAGESHLFIAGDASDYRPLLHEAADEGRIAGENAGRYPNIRAGLRRTPFSVVFSDPQIAIVGCPYSQLTDGCYAVGEVSFEDQGRSRVMQVDKGLLRVYAEHGTGRLMGAEMFGPRAEHLGHLLAWARQQRLTVTDMLTMPFYHPVIEEGLRTALRDANSKLLLGPEPIPRCMDCGPGA